MEVRIIEFVLGIISLIAGGGWFVNWRTNKLLKIVEVDKQKFSFYQEYINDIEERFRKVMVTMNELESKCDKCKYKMKHEHED